MNRAERNGELLSAVIRAGCNFRDKAQNLAIGDPEAKKAWEALDAAITERDAFLLETARLGQTEFNGFVWLADHASTRRVVQHGDDTPVWCSEVVSFVSEYRACVLHRKLVGLQRYKGHFFKVPDQTIVESAVKAMGRRAPHAYCLDFGVTDDGKTLLVEATEGFAFGHYGLNCVTYARMLAARWHEFAS
jgi:hypothetical protein